MGKLLWLVNLMLLVGVGFATSWWAGQEPDVRYGERAEFYLKDTRAPTPAADDDGNFGRHSRHRLSADALDELWQKTLFRPERTEEVAVAGDDGQDPAAAVTPNIVLELVGTGLIGPRAAAIIWDKTPVRRRPGQAAADTEKKTQHVYRVDQQVGATGYTVKEIKQGEVLLVRGDEERVLTLESGNADSEKRRARAAAERQDATAAREPVETEEKTPVAPPPPPPPPPAPAPAAAAAQTTLPSAEEMTRAERLKRAQEIRERMLERRRQQQNSN